MFLKVQLLGEPTFIFQNQVMAFPFRKVEALACYLVVEKRVSREHLGDLFWGDKDERGAAKNLRNALYHLRKGFPPEFFQGDRQRLFVGSSGMEADVDSLYNLSSLGAAELEPYGKPFMEHFSLPRCPDFEGWLREKGDFFLKLYKEELQRRVPQGDQGELEILLPRVAQLHAREYLDESVARLLMYCHCRLGKGQEVRKVFARLEKSLQEELATSPSEETRRYYHELLHTPSSPCFALGSHSAGTPSEAPKEPPFFGRRGELDKLHAFFRTPSTVPCCACITGEPGVGKSLLVTEFLKALPPETLVLSCTNIQREGGYPLSGWNDLLKNLPNLVNMEELDFSTTFFSLLGESFPSLGWHRTSREPASPTRLGEVLANLFYQISRHRRVCLVIENLQWMDEASLEVLESFFLHRPGNLAFLVTSRWRKHFRGWTMLRGLSRGDVISLCPLELGCFGLGEMEGFCRAYLPERLFSSRELQDIFDRSEGLPLFTAELLQLLHLGRPLEDIPQSLEEVMESLLEGLEEEALTLLECVAVFWDKAEWELLPPLTGLDEGRLGVLADHLQGLHILREESCNQGKLKLEYRHILVKEHIYESLSDTRRLFLHRQLGKLLMARHDRRDWDDLWGSRILGHCHRGGMELEELDYTLRKLRRRIKLNYELFPLLNDEVLRESTSASVEWNQTLEELREVKNMMAPLRGKGTSSETFHGLEMQYRSILGRYYLWWGKYGQGIHFVESALEWASAAKDLRLHRDCLQNLCYYAIQIENGRLLEHYSTLLLRLTSQGEDEAVRGGAFRFLGVAKAFQNNFDTARKMLDTSLELFEELEALDAPYTLQKAAAQSYLGFIHHQQQQFRKSLELHEKCLGECEAQGIFRGACLFHSQAAYGAYELGDVTSMDKHLRAAWATLEEQQWWRGNGILFALMALRAGQEGLEEEALKLLQRGDDLSLPLQKGSWMALQWWVKAQLKRTSLPQSPLQKALTETPQFYLEQSRAIYLAKNMDTMVHRVDQALERHDFSFP